MSLVQGHSQLIDPAILVIEKIQYTHKKLAISLLVIIIIIVVYDKKTKHPQQPCLQCYDREEHTPARSKMLTMMVAKDEVPAVPYPLPSS